MKRMLLLAVLLLCLSTVAIAGTWETPHWPGFGQFFEMMSFAFWWELAFVIGAIPILIIWFVISMVGESL